MNKKTIAASVLIAVLFVGAIAGTIFYYEDKIANSTHEIQQANQINLTSANLLTALGITEILYTPYNYLFINGSVTNVGQTTAYHAGLHVIAYDNRVLEVNLTVPLANEGFYFEEYPALGATFGTDAATDHYASSNFGNTSTQLGPLFNGQTAPIEISIFHEGTATNWTVTPEWMNSPLQLSQITISANGTVIGTNKIHRSGDTYTLKANLNASITVEKDNITLNGADFTLLGSEPVENETAISSNGTAAISLTEATNDLIENFNMTGFDTDIALTNSSNCIISGNEIYGDNNFGISLDNSWNNWVKQNDVEDTVYCGVGLYGSDGSNLVSENRIMNNLGTGLSIDSSNNVVSGNTFDKNMLYTGGGGDIGISSDDNSIIGNNITSSSGIELYEASGNLVTKNSISNCGTAVFFVGDNNTFFENNIIGNQAAVECWSITLDDTFFDNNFINNTLMDTQAWLYSEPSSPSWDNGTQGNYYGNYLSQNSNAEEVDSTGTYDTPYAITETTTYLHTHNYFFYDNHPLVNPVEFFQNVTELPFWATPTPTPTMITISEQISIIAVIAVVVASSIVLLIYRRHRKTVNLKQ